MNRAYTSKTVMMVLMAVTTSCFFLCFSPIFKRFVVVHNDTKHKMLLESAAGPPQRNESAASTRDNTSQLQVWLSIFLQTSDKR